MEDKKTNKDMKLGCSCNCPSGKKAECCTSILAISPQEISDIKKFIKKNKVTPVNRNVITTEEYHDICPFLNEEGFCNIYNVRPEICRWFNCSLEESKKLEFNHKNKKIANLMEEFFPEEYCPCKVDVKEMDKFYQKKKRDTKRGK